MTTLFWTFSANHSHNCRFLFAAPLLVNRFNCQPCPRYGPPRASCFMLFTQIVSAVALALALKVDSVACHYCKHTQLYMDVTWICCGSSAGAMARYFHSWNEHVQKQMALYNISSIFAPKKNQIMKFGNLGALFEANRSVKRRLGFEFRDFPPQSK